MYFNLPPFGTGNLNRYSLIRKILVFFIIPLFFGLLSLLLGKDINWDLKNYHYYNAYAFLEGRINYDIAPAQLQTYINPFGDLLFYWLVKNYPSWGAGILLGVIHGINISLVFLIFLKVTTIPKINHKVFIGVCLSFVASIAPGFISELGNTMNDNLTSIFVLGALLLLLSVLKDYNNLSVNLGIYYIGFAGFVMGFGVGIKPSVAIFAVSSGIVFALFQETLANKFKAILIYSVAGMLGGIASAGFWWWAMWEKFGNPFFPFYNHIFKSPYFTVSSVVWRIFLPESWWEYILWPFIFSMDGYRVNQIQYLDIRFAILYIALFCWFLMFVYNKIRNNALIQMNNANTSFNHKLTNFLLFFFLLSYVLWINESSTYRFLIPLELLVPICFWAVIERFIYSKKAQIITLISAFILIFVFFRPFNWGRINWSSSYFEVDTSVMTDVGTPIVVMLGSSPTSYVIPEFPPNYRFLRPEGNLFKGSDGSYRETAFLLRIEEVLANNNDQLYILYNGKEKDMPSIHKSLEQLALNADIEKCFLLNTNIPDELWICRLSKR